jgi:uncharacterized protein YjbI with pentapeptide repeats
VKGDGGRQEDRPIRCRSAGKVAERFGDKGVDDLGKLSNLLALSPDRRHDRHPSSAFLAEPVKLPVLNIDLPLWGFFWLAPILFVIFHAYVLIQLILLARTAAAYDAAVAKLIEDDNLSPEANASLRQRLANTLFAQILAGSPREREGWFGSLLKAMAWITLVIAPILILLTFQFMFLPYHSHLATWTHRLLILLEFVVAFKLWPLVLNPKRDFRWLNSQWGIKERTLGVTSPFGSSEQWQRARQGLRRVALPMAATALFILLPLSLATFPGEPHVNLLTGQARDDVQCRRWLQQKFDFADMRFDRLALARVDVVDHDKLEKIQQATSKVGEPPYRGERTRILRDRDFNCGDFSDYADLRRIDFNGAHLRNANFTNAKLDGTSFAKSKLQGASFSSARLRSASFYDTQLQGASFLFASLQGAALDHANLQGAFLFGSYLQGASLDNAKLQGATLGLAGLPSTMLGFPARRSGAPSFRAHPSIRPIFGAPCSMVPNFRVHRLRTPTSVMPHCPAPGFGERVMHTAPTRGSPIQKMMRSSP